MYTFVLDLSWYQITDTCPRWFIDHELVRDDLIVNRVEQECSTYMLKAP